MWVFRRAKSVLFIVVVLVVVAAIWIGKGRSVSLQGKRYGKVKRGDLIQRVTVSGQVQPLKRTTFIPPFSGYIHRIFVKVGQKVKQGDPIVSVASSLSSAEQIFPIRAPFDGVVVDVKKNEGEFVTEKQEKDAMVRIDNSDKFFVVVKAAELDATRVKRDMEVEIQVNALRQAALKGLVREIDLAAEEADGWKAQQATFDVRVEVLNPPPELRSGQSAILDIVTDRYKDVLYLEHEFINQEGDQYFVVTRSGKRKNIQVGRQSDLAMEVVSVLKEGEEIEQIDFLKLLETGS